jgi:hypothetical protein
MAFVIGVCVVYPIAGGLVVVPALAVLSRPLASA